MEVGGAAIVTSIRVGLGWAGRVILEGPVCVVDDIEVKVTIGVEVCESSGAAPSIVVGHLNRFEGSVPLIVEPLQTVESGGEEIREAVVIVVSGDDCGVVGFR